MCIIECSLITIATNLPAAGSVVQPVKRCHAFYGKLIIVFPLDSILSQMSPVHSLVSFFFKIHFCIKILRKPIPPKWTFTTFQY